eukprot:TRINITY_DN66636_c0_g1_i1.p2 TRINITY_DN66636_c0_g1~~TRINITY_DN66636_c0_g1_i1.p2  ORF type:complete len:149 (-),score=31.39 TRINITY_DN66636_c0_g1_i1:4-450(-)
MAMAQGITTICIQGFPQDASARELKNFCRFVPGFEGAHVGFSNVGPTALFVKFETNEYAAAAIDFVAGVVFDTDAAIPGPGLKAEFARREMEVRASALPSPLMSADRMPMPHKAMARSGFPSGPRNDFMASGPRGGCFGSPMGGGFGG